MTAGLEEVPTVLATKKFANGLPDSSAESILRVQGEEKQACSMANNASSMSVVAGSMVTDIGLGRATD